MGAGSGHCIQAPNGEREGIVRSGFAPQGVRPVFVKARGLSSACPRFVVFRPARVCGHGETPTGLGGPIRLPLSECGGDSYRITYMKARIGFAIATLAVGVTKVTES